MGISVSVNKKFKINGQVYSSPEEMPADVRAIYDAAMKRTGADGQPTFGKLADTRLNISFNGKQFGSPDEMPDDERKLYEDALAMMTKQGGAGATTPPPVRTAAPRTRSASPALTGGAIVRDRPNTSLRAVIAVVASLLVAGVLFYVRFSAHR
jgi:hypothetical protein